MTQASDESSLDRPGSELGRRYRQLPVDSVPADLDRLILDHARAAVAVPGAHRWWIHWGLPLALVGSALLAATLILNGPSERTASTAATESAPLLAIQAELAAVQPSAGEPASVSAPPATTTAELPAVQAAPSEITRGTERAAKVSAAPDVPSAMPLEEPLPVLTEVVAESRPATQDPGPQTAPVSTSSTPLEPAVSTAAAETPPAAEPEAGSIFEGLDALRQRATAAGKQAAAEDRLEDIRHLRQSGRRRAADLAWRRFLQDFPEYPVAADDIARPRDQ